MRRNPSPAGMVTQYRVAFRGRPEGVTTSTNPSEFGTSVALNRRAISARPSPSKSPTARSSTVMIRGGCQAWVAI